jgi:PAS domain S-box-containing protein
MVQGVVYHDAEGHIISMNPAAEEILGFTFDIIKYKTSNDSIWQAIHEDGTPFPGEEHPAMVALKTGKEVKNVIMGVKNPSKNGYRWLNIHAVPELRQWEDKPYQVYTTFEDITDRKQIEAALKESEISLGEAQRIANIGSWEWNIQKDDITWSNELYSIYGVDPNTFTPTISSFADYIHPDDQETVNNIINQIISQGISVDFDFRIISTDGSTHILNTVAEVTDFDEDGNPRLMVGINQDITERREKELLNNALNKVNAYINSTLEYDEIMQLIMDLGAKALNVESSIINVREGDNWVVKFAYNFPDDIIGQIRSNKESPTSVYVEDRKEAVAFNDAANDSRVNKDGMKLHGVTSLLVAPIILKDEFKGIIAFYHHQKSVIFSEEEIDFANKLAFYLSQAIENATLFDEIRNSEEKYHSLYSSMREGVALHEIIYNQSQEAVDYIILDINPAYEKITGLNRSEVVGMKASVLYGTGTPPYLEFYAPVAENAEPTEFESYFEPMDKTFHISVVSPGKGKFATIFEDITERKQAEELLQNTLLRFYNILSSMYGAILLVTDKNRVEFVNQAFCDLFEFDDSPQNLMGLNAYEMIEKIQNVYLNPKEALIRIDEIVSRGKPVKGEEVALRGGRTVMRDFIPIYVDEISFGRLWHHVDITERKNAEKASSDLASIVENSDDAIIGKDLAGIITSWNNGAEKIYGYSTSEAIGRNINFLIPKNYPDDTKLLLDKVRNHIKVFNHETKRLTKDGKIIDVSITVSPIINSD